MLEKVEMNKLFLFAYILTGQWFLFEGLKAAFGYSLIHKRSESG